MNDAVVQWKQWLSNVPSDQHKFLFEALGGGGNGSTHYVGSLCAVCYAPQYTTPGGVVCKNGHGGAESLDPETLLSKLTSPQSEQNAHKVNVTRTKTADLYVKNAPAFVDVFSLKDIYKKISFESNLIIKGPKGDGKSVSVISYANEINCPIIIQECSEDTKAYNLQGSQFLLGEETVFVLGCIPAAIDVANEVGQCILLFEELNALTPQVQKQLNAITDFRKMSSLPHLGKTYRLRDGAKLWVVGTMNPSVYGGTYDLNEDLKSRFEELEVTYPAAEQEKRILKTVCTGVPDPQLDLVIRFAHETRQQATGYALSTRDLVRFVQTIVKTGLDTALQMVLCKFEGQDRDTVMKSIQRTFPNIKPLKKHWGAIS